MQLANVQVAIGGDRGNTVTRYRVTPAEIAVLRVIHGSDAVYDVDPLNRSVDRASHVERDRLMVAYGKSEDGQAISAPAVEKLFPGMGANLPTRLDQVGIMPQQYMAVMRKGPTGGAKLAVVEEREYEEAFDSIVGRTALKGKKPKAPETVANADEMDQGPTLFDGEFDQEQDM